MEMKIPSVSGTTPMPVFKYDTAIYQESVNRTVNPEIEGGPRSLKHGHFKPGSKVVVYQFKIWVRG